MHGQEKITRERTRPFLVTDAGRSYDLLITFTLRRLMNYIPIIPTP